MEIKLDKEQLYYQLNDIFDCVQNRDNSQALVLIEQLINKVRNS
jgi:hypothetical protein